MIPNHLLFAVTFAAGALADDTIDPIKLPGTQVTIQQTNLVQVTKDAKPPIFRDELIRFSVTPTDSSAKSFIVAGKVVNNNSGAPTELIPLYFGSSLHAPRLAALTNADGEFRFRIWLKEDQRETRLQTPSLGEGVLYLGSADIAIYFGVPTDERSMSAFVYSFRDLLEASKPTLPSTK